MKDETKVSFVVRQLELSAKGKLKYKTPLEDLSNLRACMDEWILPPRSEKKVKVHYIPKDPLIIECNSLVEDATPQPNGSFDNGPSYTHYPEMSNSQISMQSCNGNATLCQSEEYLKHRQLICRVKEEFVNKTKGAIDAHYERFNSHHDEMEKRMQEQIRNLELLKISEEKQSLQRHLAIRHIEMKDQEARLEKLKEDRYSKEMDLKKKLKDLDDKNQILLEEAKKAEQYMKNFISRITNLKENIFQLCDTIMQQYDSFNYKEMLPPSCSKIHETLTMIRSKAVDILRECQHPIIIPIDQSESKMNVLLHEATTLSEVTSKTLGDINLKVESDNLEKSRRDQQVLDHSKTIENIIQESVDRCVDITAYTEYTNLMTTLTQLEEKLKPFSSKDPKINKLQFSLQKAVNTPINAISSVNGHHLLDKVHKLRMLLDGQTVEVGSSRVSTNEHPLAHDFVIGLLAKMIVKKAEEQVSSKHSTAFPLAMVTVGVCSGNEYLRDLLFAYFFRSCPYLVPYYMNREDGVSEDEYLKQLGYKYTDGVIEKQDKFLKRMSGFMHLYSALMVSPPPPRFASMFPIQNAWLWLSRILNLFPDADVTATLLLDLLQVCGSALYRTYKKQFSKLLQILLSEYLGKIDSVIVSAGPVSRLRTFLQTCIESGCISEPEGILAARFWST